MKYLTRRLLKLTSDEINTLLKTDTILSDIRTKMKMDMVGNDYESVTLNLYYDYDDNIKVPYALIAEIDRILYALANCTEIITEVNDEGDENGK